MNYLSGALRYVSGSETDARDVVPRLIERIKSSALPQDRRSAILLLTEAAKRSPDSQAQIGELGLKVIYAVLEQDKEYDDTLRAALDLLIAICAALDPPASAYPPDPADTSELNPNTTAPPYPSGNAGLSPPNAATGTVSLIPTRPVALSAFEVASTTAATTNIDAFLGLPNAVSLLLELLDKADFYVKFSTIELLTAMAANSRNTLQVAILEAPQGVSRVCDLLDDGHRHVRTNAVLLLSTLCEQSPEICKIVAYGGVLEKLFHLIDSVSASASQAANGATASRNGSHDIVTADDSDSDDDDSLEAAIVVHDVLQVVRNLIQGTNTTRTFMRDSGCTPRLVLVLVKAAFDAGLIDEKYPPGVAAPATGLRSAVQRQAKKNLILGLRCVTGLVGDGDEEATLVKNDLASTELFKTLATLAFSKASSVPNTSAAVAEHNLQVRILALRTIAMLVRGHEEFRILFGSSSCALGNGDTSSAQVWTMRAMCHDPSASVRVAAFAALRESFVVDAGLDLPSSALLNALTGSRAGSMASASDLISPSNAVLAVAESLKAALVGWPADADTGAVFYSACLVSWVILRVQGARERLLGSHVHGGTLLQQIIRVFAKVEREQGPAAVRISLLSLVCVWLHGSPSAVSAFLSSAMHLPMVVDILNSAGNRGDVGEVHTHGLAAVLLGICLEMADGDSDASSDGGFISGGGGPSTVVPKGTIADVIRHRVGITNFTASLDDLRSTRPFSLASSGPSLWGLAEGIASSEESSGLFTPSGHLGHDRWYEADMAALIDEVYGKVAARAFDLMAQKRSNGRGPFSVSDEKTNGFKGSTVVSSDALTSHGSDEALIADSARDEVLNSYKEFIRSQDESLIAARRQIEELGTALKEAQVQLDRSAVGGPSGGKTAEELERLQEVNLELSTRAQALEVIIDEKNADFAALSDAYASLEEDRSTVGLQAASTLEGGVDSKETYRLRERVASLQQSLDRESARSSDLATSLASKERQEGETAIEMRGLIRERDALRDAASVDVTGAVEWQRRAEVAEAQLAARLSALDAVESDRQMLQESLRLSETALLDARHEASANGNVLERVQGELSELQSLRKRELQVSRESNAAASAQARAEVTALESEIASLQNTRAIDMAFADNEDYKSKFSSLNDEFRELLSTLESLKAEAQDSKSAVREWQRRAEANEAAKEREVLENVRLSSLARDLQSSLESTKATVSTHTDNASASARRVNELEQQCADLEEMRRRAEEELLALKEEVSSRTEQSIQLSGKLYEAEEARANAEEAQQLAVAQLVDSQNAVAAIEGGLRTPGAETGIVKDDVSEHQSQATIRELKDIISRLDSDLRESNDALVEQRDEASLAAALRADRDSALARIESLGQETADLMQRNADQEAELGELKNRLLLLGEAEEAKRALTMDVVRLQSSLADATRGIQTAQEGSSEGSASASLGVASALQTEVNEKTMRVQELESSLTSLVDRYNSLQKERDDLEKQVAEADATLSVTSAERDELRSKCDQMAAQLETETSTRDEQERPLALELETKLTESEERKVVLSEKLERAQEMRTHAERRGAQLSEEIADLRKQLSDANRRMASDSSKISLLETSATQAIVSQSVQTCALEAAVSASHTDAEERIAVLSEKSRRAEEHVESVVQQNVLLQKLVDEAETKEASDQELADSEATKEIVRQFVKISELEVSLSAALTSAKDSVAAAKRERDDAYRARDEAIALQSSFSAEFQGATQRSKESTVEPGAADRAQSESTITPGREVVGGSQLPVSSLDTTSLPSSRTVELEHALRDAAKTVSMTNRELVAAQALLVEISADKTAMRTELTAAQREVQELLTQLSIAKSSVGAPLIAVGGDVASQPLELETSNTTESADDIGRDNFVMDAEVGNLRTILARSVSEAESAWAALSSVEAKIILLETKLKTSETDRKLAVDAETRLSTELSNARAASTCTADELVLVRAKATETERGLVERSNILQQEIEALNESHKVERDTLSAQLDKESRLVFVLTSERDTACAKITATESDLKMASSRITALEMSKEKLEVALSCAEDSLKKMTTSYEDACAREIALIAECKALRSSHEDELRAAAVKLSASLERDAKRIQALEDDVERGTEALENAERRQRDLEISARAAAKGFAVERDVLEAELATARGVVEHRSRELEAVQLAKASMEGTLRSELDSAKTSEADLSQKLERSEKAIENTRLEKERLETKVATAQGRLDTSVQQCETLQTLVSSLETEKKHMVTTVDVLGKAGDESRARISSLERDIGILRSDKTVVSANLEGERTKVSTLRSEVSDLSHDMKGLRAAKAKLEDTVDGLRERLDSVEAARDSVNRDNQDLRAWVSDLERRATELQSAASNFEEVEQSLRETVEAHTVSLDANAALAEELEKTKAALAASTLQSRATSRDVQAAERARESSQKRVDELEGRIRDIREEHQHSIGVSEERLREKASRCAELESSLGAAERRLAELATVSDELFGLRSKLAERESDAAGLQVRATSAEERADDLQQHLDSMSREVLELQRSTNGDAFRALEAEHNELLVCLAELELECTTLKEALGTE